MLLVPIGPLALMLTPTVVRRGRRRLAIHGSADPLQYITRTLRVRRHRIKHEHQRKSQDRPLYHFNPPLHDRSKHRIRTCAAISNTAERASVPALILLPFGGARMLMADGRDTVGHAGYAPAQLLSYSSWRRHQ